MNVLISGASGLVGSALVHFLKKNDHRVVTLVRGAGGLQDGMAGWNPETGEIDLTRAGRLDAAVHLAGETIAQRWSKETKRRIRDSRVKGTRLLCESLAGLPQLPEVLLSASASGFYGDRGEEWLEETSDPGRGFLAEVAQAWESATAPATARGIRVVNLRLGIVLAKSGGALKKMLPAFRLGLGGRLADGRAYWSWIALDDVLGAIGHALTNEALSGPVNVVSPNPVTNAEFTRTLGHVLHRPTFFTVPRFAVELLFGQMGREALLASFRVRPTGWWPAGFNFSFRNWSRRFAISSADR
jgi:uncharacterized protein (TIGR01777 family)